jgi:hypothetical protein
MYVCSCPRLYSSVKQPETRHVQASIAVLPTPCSSPYATIPFFNTAKATVPRLATMQSFEWVLFAMVDGKYEQTNISCVAMHREDLKIHQLHLHFQIVCIVDVSSCCRIDNSTARQNSMPQLTAGTAADQTLFSSTDTTVTTAQLHVDSNSLFSSSFFNGSNSADCRPPRLASPAGSQRHIKGYC